MHCSRRLLLLLPLFLLCLCTSCLGEDWTGDDLYQVLGLSKDATSKEIRKAFKSLAVKLHPDKNQDDENATSKFAQITKAYEVLKDPDARKQYDLYGDIDERKNKKDFHTYTYYKDHFGIYDDDPLITTLTRAEFELYVIDSKQVWFVNFYSGECHHCHELAPTWRKLASELEGVIRVGAVNCMDDWILCNRLGIQAYPTLLYYDGQVNVYSGSKYYGERTFETLHEYVMSQVDVDVQELKDEAQLGDQNWLLILCPDGSSVCPDMDTQKKLSAILGNAMSVAIVTDAALCDKLYKGYKDGEIVYYEVTKDGTGVIRTVKGSSVKEIVNEVTNLLPDPKQLNEEDVNQLKEQLQNDPDAKSLFICFYMGNAIDVKLQMKRLPKLLQAVDSGLKTISVDLGIVNCAHNANLCSQLHISRYPLWGVLKKGSAALELHTGTDTLHELASFALESAQHSNLYTLTPGDFKRIKRNHETWFIDWYAPWCPPCRQLLPELRRASGHVEAKGVKFGTIDCTVHSSLCKSEGIGAYPTTHLYTSDGRFHNFHGVPNQDGISEFIGAVLNPMVIHLDAEDFDIIRRKTELELWVVSFYAPWCGPCNRLKPHLHKVAAEMKHLSYVKIGQIDCEENRDLCSQQRITHYPTVRMYPLDTKGMNTVILYNGYYTQESMLQWLDPFLLKPHVDLSSAMFKLEVLEKAKPYIRWLVMFHRSDVTESVEYLETFKNVAGRVKEVKSGLVDCVDNKELCKENKITKVPQLRLYSSATKWHSFDIDETNCFVLVNKVRMILKHHSGHDEL